MKAPDDVLQVVMNGRQLGDIQRISRHRMRLQYFDVDAATPLSISMPLSRRRHREKDLAPWLEGLLPDRPATVRQWRRQFGVTDTDAFPLLRHVGEDVAGAAQFVRPERLESVIEGEGTIRELDRTQIAEMLRRARADLPVSPGSAPGGKFSLAGAQAKIALHKTPHGWSDPSGAIPSTHILKPAIPGRDDQDLVEHVTMRTAAALGLRVARTTVTEFEDLRAIVVTRYDRVNRDTGWLRVHQEDMCQAMGLWPSRKYEAQGGPGAETVARLIRLHSTGPEGADNRHFAQALVFNWVSCATDAHARNHSLLLSGNSVRLAPLYDLNSHLAYSNGRGIDLSMSILGTFRADLITGRDWARFAPALCVDPDWLCAEVSRQAATIVDALRDAIDAAEPPRSAHETLERLRSNAAVWATMITTHAAR